MKKLACILFAVVSLSLISASCSDKESESIETSPVYESFSVMSETVTSEEIEYFVKRDRAQVINYYSEKYGITDFSNFWESKEFDVVPSERLLSIAKKDAIEAKAKLILMKENDVYDDISFNALKKKAETFNKEHTNKSNNIGINSIDLSSFYTYYVSTGEMELKNILSKDKLKPSESEIKEKQKENPDLTEEGVISAIVSEKYEKMLAEMIEKIK